MKIVLEKWSLNDAEALVRICNNTDHTYLTGRMPYPYYKSDAIKWLNMAINADGKGALYRKIIYDGEIVGSISLEGKCDIYSHDCSVGYFLDKDYMGCGIMTDATKQIIALGFSLLDINRISSRVLHENYASAKVLEKCGFIKEGLMRSGAYKNERYYDVIMFALYKSALY